jgi:hypothetical protein
MSFDIPNISPVSRALAPASPRPAQTDRTAPAPRVDEPVTVDTMPAAPPPEVLDAIGAAAGAYDRLAAGGLQLHFCLDEQTGKVATQVYDLHGTVLGTLSPSQVVDIATTGTFD